MTAPRQNAPRVSLPNIGSLQLSYSERYEHTTKLVNYSQLNEAQIWKEYQRLRHCLKELNEEVLQQMQRKVYSNLANKPKASKDSQATLVLLADEKKANQARLSSLTAEGIRQQERIKELSQKGNFLEQLQREGQKIRIRLKQAIKQNKTLKREAALQGKDLVKNVTAMGRLLAEEERLALVSKQHKSYQENKEKVAKKIGKYREKIGELQTAIESRVDQFSQQESLLSQETHLKQYEELKRKRQAVQLYEPIYKRNYLMKLKELEALMTSIAKHDKILHETQANIINMRREIDVVKALTNSRKRSCTSVIEHGLNQRVSKDKQKPFGIVQKIQQPQMNFSIELNNCNLETIAVKMPGLNSKDEEQKDIGRCE